MATGRATPSAPSLPGTDASSLSPLDALPGPVWLSDPDGGRGFLNRAWLAFTGREAEQERGDGWRGGIHPDDRDRVLTALAAAVRDRHDYSVEYRLRHASGEYRWVTERVAARFAPDGGFLGHAGQCADLSPLRQVQEALAASEEELRNLETNIPGVVYRCLWDKDLTVQHISDSIQAVSGYPASDFVDGRRSLADLIHPDDRERVRAEISEQIKERRGFVVEYRIIDARERVRWVLESGKAHYYSRRGRPQWLSGAVFDVTDLKAAEEQLRQAAIVFDNTTEGIMVTDARGDILAVNQAFTEITGYAAEEVLGRNPRLLSSGHHGEDYYRAMWEALRDTGKWRGEIWNRHKDGETFPLLQTISTVRDSGGEVTGYVSMFSDITHIKQTEARLEKLAYHDALTGLPNRLLFDERLEHAIQQAQRHGERLALLYFDLDRFKSLNDTLGHQVGDELLQAIAQRLGQRLRKSDTLSRRGGDEFTVLIENLREPEQAVAVARDILRQLAAPFLLPSGNQVQTGSSIGIALYPDDGLTAQQLTMSADAAMYEAKQGGRGQYRFHTQALTNAARQRMELETRLRLAVEAQALQLVYQPLYDVGSGRLIGTEALLRWRDAELGEVAPAHFIPIAEEAGLMDGLGDWALRRACGQAAAWRDAGLPALRMAVNISLRQLRGRDFAGQVRGALEATALPPAQLELELTEATLLQLDEAGSAALRALQALGVSITVEDFGIGYSSLTRLRQLPVNRLKVDRSFVGDIPRDEDDMKIVSIIVAMARTLRLGVTAEGVETEEQLRFIRAEQCDAAQGYLLARPVEPELIPGLLKAAARPGDLLS
jgi:diguanylate cyclase (GGDEF)-like protein/PAS domain S-box-containing protein